MPGKHINNQSIPAQYSEPADLLRISDTKANINGYTYGEKGLRLLEISRLGVSVPDGVLLSVEFLERMIKASNLQKHINDICEMEKNGNTGLNEKVATLLDNAYINPFIRHDLRSNLCAISGFNHDMLFAVRSAALGEDNEKSSCAGQYETFLNVNFKNIWQAIFKCYASWWTLRAISYRRQNNMEFDSPRISVIIQRQIDPDYSGVLFTRHPFKTKNTMIVEAVTGLCEKLVSGEVTPAKWEISAKTKKNHQIHS